MCADSNCGVWVQSCVSGRCDCCFELMRFGSVESQRTLHPHRMQCRENRQAYDKVSIHASVGSVEYLGGRRCCENCTVCTARQATRYMQGIFGSRKGFSHRELLRAICTCFRSQICESCMSEWGMITFRLTVATPCWPAPVSAMTLFLPIRLQSKACPKELLILCAPV